MVAGVLTAGLTAAGLVAVGGVAAADATMPTCTITTFVMAPTSAGGKDNSLAVIMGNDTGACLGAYTFIGITASSLGYPDQTTGNYAELAAALRHWSNIDGVPAMDEWVNLFPDVTAGMKAAGINPTMFLQWLNEHDGGAPWPPFLPQGTVTDPAAIVGGTPDQTVSAPKPTPPPQATPQPAAPAPAPAPASATVPTSTTRSGVSAATSSTGSPSGGQVAPASSTSAPPSPPKKAPAAAPASASVPPVAPALPPATVTTDGLTVPCVVGTACRQAVVAHDKWDAVPWYEKAGLQVWWHRWWEIAALAVMAAATVGTRAVLIARRNLAWYGNVRGPR